MSTSEVTVIVIVAVAIAFVVGAFLGLAAEENYIKKHCELTGKFVIDKETYECRKLPKA